MKEVWTKSTASVWGSISSVVTLRSTTGAVGAGAKATASVLEETGDILNDGLNKLAISVSANIYTGLSWGLSGKGSVLKSVKILATVYIVGIR